MRKSILDTFLLSKKKVKQQDQEFNSYKERRIQKFLALRKIDGLTVTARFSMVI